MYGKNAGKSITNRLYVEIRMANYVEIRIEKIAGSSRLEAGRLKAKGSVAIEGKQVIAHSP